MFSLKKKSLTRVICAALTFMSALPFGVAKADKYGNNTVTVTDAGATGDGIFWGVTEIYIYGSEFNKLTVDVNKNYKNNSWFAAYIAPNDIWNVLGPVHNNELWFKNGTANDLNGGSINKNDYYNDVWENSVIVTGGTAKNVYGGWTGKAYYKKNMSGQAYNNSVTIEGGTVNEVCGGYSAANSSYANTVNITGGNVGNVFGSRSWGADFLGIASHDNSVTVSGGKVNGNIHGGYNGLETYKNSVTLTGGTVNGNIYGGFSADGNLYSNSYWNTVSIAGGTIIGNTYGGYSDRDGYAHNNIVTVTKGTIKGNIYGGSQNSNYDLYNNTVNIGSENSADKITITGNVYGGSNLWGNPRDNIVNIGGSEITGKIYGGHTDTDIAYRNTVTIDGATTKGDIYGGWSNNDTYNNTINFNMGTFINGNIIGGYSTNTRSYNNTVNFSGNMMKDKDKPNPVVYGSYSENGTAYNNTVNIISNLHIYDIYGSYSKNGKAYGNTLTVKSSDGNTIVYGDILGSASVQDSAYGNALTVKSTNLTKRMQVHGNIYGSKSVQGSAYGNTLNISNLEMRTDSIANIYGSKSEQGSAYGNTLNISAVKGYKTTSSDMVMIFGSSSAKDACDNTANITDSTVNRVFGGRADSGIVSGNIVNLSNTDVIKDTSNKYGDVYGGSNTNGEVKENTVNILNGSSIDKDVYGGYSTKSNATGNTVNLSDKSWIAPSVNDACVYGGYSKEGNAQKNVVNLNSGTLGVFSVEPVNSVTVYGGYSDSGAAVGNTVNIYGDKINNGKVVDIYGGYSKNGKAYDNTVNLLTQTTVKNLYGGNDKSSTSNTLNVYQADNKVTGKLDGFHIVNFFVPDTAPGAAMLTAGSANFNQYSVINLDKVSAYNLTLLKYESLSAKDLLYSIGSNRIYGGTNTAVKENGHVTVASGQFVNDTTKNEIRWEVNPGTFYTGVYYAADGNKTNADNNKAVLASAPAGIKKVYGSYSENAGIKAEGGTVELAGKIERAGTDGLNLIGGFNSASTDKVGSNTLNVLGAAAGSKVKTVDKFNTINLYAPGGSTSTPLLYADTINFVENSTINLDVIPTYNLTLLNWNNWYDNGKTITYKFAGVKGELDTLYFRATADEANHRVTVAEGKLSIADKSLKWTVKDGAFYTGIYYPIEGAAFPGANVKDNKVILYAETAKGANTVYGSYSANSTQSATGGIVELAGKIERTGATDGLNLIGGKNTAEGGTVGFNTLNVLGAAAGSSVKSISDFTNIEYEVSDTKPETDTPMITAATANLSNTKIKLKDMPTYSFTLLKADELSLNQNTKYFIGDKDLTGGKTYSKLLENKYQYLLGEQGKFNVSETEKTIAWNVNKFLTAIYTEADKKTQYSNDQKTIFMRQYFEVPEGVTQIYGSYSDNKNVSATGGTIDLTAKQSLDSIDLIGGYNSADAKNVGSNTLNVLSAAAGSKVKSVSAFDTINLYTPGYSTTPLLYAGTINFDKASTINLDVIPTYDLTLLKWDNWDAKGNTITYKFAGVEGGLGEYFRATADEANHRVTVAKGELTNDGNSLKWAAKDGAFYTGIYYPREGAAFPGANVKDNKVILNAETAMGTNTVYGSYSANGGQPATNGVVELAGKIERVGDGGLQLIGGKNMAEGGTVGNNTLNVSGSAAGSKVKSVSVFDTINFYLPTVDMPNSVLLSTDSTDLAKTNLITFDKAPAYDLTLLNNVTNKESVKFKVGNSGEHDAEYIFNDVLADKQNYRVAVTSGKFTAVDSNLSWNTDPEKSFYTGVYTDASGKVTKVSDNNSVILNSTPGVNKVYGSYSANAEKKATDGKVELAGKIERDGDDGLELIGGYNSAAPTDASKVGTNTLSVSAAAAGSKVKSVSAFDTINLYTPGYSTGTTPLLYAKTINFDKESTINLDVIPTYDLTLLKWDNWDAKGNTITYKFAGVEGGLGKYFGATADEANHRVAVATGELTNDGNSLKWTVTGDAFYTGIYYPREGAAFPGANVKDNKVILYAETAMGTNTVYGSYSANRTQSATGGIVELAGKIERTGATDGLNLIGGKNTAEGGTVGFNTLNVLGAAAGSSVNSIKDFSEIDFYVPDETGTMLTVSDGNIAGAKIKLEYAPAFDLTLLSADNINKSETTYWIGDKQLTADATNENQYNYSNIANNNTNVLVSKGYIDTSTAIFWKNEASILTGKYIDETGKTYSAANNTIVLDNRLTIPAGIKKIYGSYNENGDATGGTVDIAGKFDHDDIELIGGYGGNVSGNTLNVRSIGNIVKGISNFENMNFYVPKDAVAGRTMLLVYGDVNLQSVKQIKASIATGSTLKKDNTVNLLASTGNMTNVNADMKADLIGTGLVKVDASIAQNGDRIVLTINKDVPNVPTELSDDSKSLVETRAAGMALLNNGADLATGKGFINAKAAAEAENIAIDKHTSYTPYAAVGGNNMRYETGSYVDSKGWGINVGFSRVLNYKNSKLTLVPFVEYGKSSYDSYLNNGTHGSGDNSFTGIGFMAKKEQNDGIYYEGSVRLGRAKADYNGGEMLGEYDTSSNYLAFHAGIGKVQELSKKSNINYYGKLFYTHQEGDDVTVNRPHIGDSFVYNFDAINSCRLRLGTRFTQKLNKTDSFYAGLAWDYEFDSEARAHYMGLSTPAPTMKGSSGMLELGWKQEATKENPFGVDLGLTGWCGKQRGISFNAGFSWAF